MKTFGVAGVGTEPGGCLSAWRDTESFAARRAANLNLRGDLRSSPAKIGTFPGAKLAIWSRGIRLKNLATMGAFRINHEVILP